MNTLIISPFFSPNIGGVETHLDDLLSYLSDNGINVFVITYQPLTTKIKGKFYERRKTAMIFRLPWIGGNLFHKLEPFFLLEFIYLTFPLLLFSLFFVLFMNRKIDIIHSQGITATFIGLICGKVFGKKHISSVHAIYNLSNGSLKANLIKMLLNNSDKILTLSNRSMRELSDIGVQECKLARYYYWIDQNEFNIQGKESAKRELGWDNKIVVLFVGRLIEIKGIDIFLDLAKNVKHDNVRFVAIGDGPLEKLLGEQKIDNFSFLGKIENDRISKYYKSADILCVPSKYEEGYGRVILEGLSCGLAVVASNVGGIPEIIDERNGILCEPATGSFLKAVERLITDSDFRIKLSQAGFAFAKQSFSRDNGKIISDSYKLVMN